LCLVDYIRGLRQRCRTLLSNNFPNLQPVAERWPIVDMLDELVIFRDWHSGQIGIIIMPSSAWVQPLCCVCDDFLQRRRSAGAGLQAIHFRARPVGVELDAPCRWTTERVIRAIIWDFGVRST
jgi:hypothetical protein